MPKANKMTIDERRKYLRLLQDGYRQGGKSERGRLLDSMEATTGLHRKSLIRLMAGNLERKPRRKNQQHTPVAKRETAGVQERCQHRPARGVKTA